MPIPDNVNDRLKAALVPSRSAADDGAPMLLVGDPSGWTAGPTDSAVNAAVTITRNPDADERALVTGFEVALRGAGAATPVTVNLLGSGAAVIWGTFIQSGSGVGIIRDWSHPITAGLAATCQLYVGPGGASVITTANLRGYSAGGG